MIHVPAKRQYLAKQNVYLICSHIVCDMSVSRSSYKPATCMHPQIRAPPHRAQDSIYWAMDSRTNNDNKMVCGCSVLDLEFDWTRRTVCERNSCVHNTNVHLSNLIPTIRLTLHIISVVAHSIEIWLQKHKNTKKKNIFAYVCQFDIFTDDKLADSARSASSQAQQLRTRERES